VKLLDLFCGAGGASKGYAQAGFEVTGIDVKHGKNYPFNYIRGDVRDYLDIDYLRQFDAIAASPPCQTFSATKHLRDAQGGTSKAINMIPEVREALINSGKLYVIENVPQAPLFNAVQLCGSGFQLKVRRHRLFESNVSLLGNKCLHKEQGKPIGVYGAKNDTAQGVDRVTGKYVIGGSTAKTLEEGQEAMGIDWMNWSELREAIPPAYTEFIGRQIIQILKEAI